MDSKPKLTKEERKEAVLKSQAANEKIFKLVVKIISWKSGPMEGATIKKTDKVTPDEWQRYRTHILRISKTESEKRVREKLDDTYKAIKANGGFKRA